MSGTLDRLIDHALGAPATLADPAARAAARVFLLDTLAVGIAGARVPDREALIRAVAGSCDGGGEGTRLLGDGRRLPAAAAALVNAWQIHNQEFDCVHEGAVVHPMAVVGGVLLAVAEREALRGRVVPGAAFADAMIVAVDVAATVGLCAREPMRFFRPAMAGALGALAGAARFAGLDADAVRRAYGLLLAQLSGTMQAHVEGTPGLPLQIGFNARAAVTALDLAAAGVDAPRDALEGPFGYFQSFEGRFDLSAFDTLGKVARITEVSHKPFPTGRAAHGALDGLARLDAAAPIDADALESVVLFAPPLVRRLVDRPAGPGMRPSWARLCLPWLVATWLEKRGVDVTDVEAAALANAARLARAAGVHVEPNGVEDPNALVPQRLELRFTDGAVRSVDLDAVLGSPARPLSRAAQLAKLSACLDAAPARFDAGPRDRLVAAIDALDAVPDITRLVDLAIGDPNPKEAAR
jgi:2-methylcitrate dehydratase PrpD